MADKRITVYVLQQGDRPFLKLEYVDPDTGCRRSKSAKTADPKDAEKARADWEYELNHGLHQEPSKMPWERFREIYEEEKLAGVREATRKKAGYVFDKFEELAHPRALGKITERTLSRYSVQLRENGFKAATIQGHLAYLRAALRWAADQKFIQVAPKVTMPKVPKKTTVRKIVTEEFERLLAVSPDDAWTAFLQTAWYTGMRRNEMLDLTWDGARGTPWVDFGAAKIRIPPSTTRATPTSGYRSAPSWPKCSGPGSSRGAGSSRSASHPARSRGSSPSWRGRPVSRSACTTCADRSAAATPPWCRRPCSSAS
jgi:hypothetical protein